MRHRSTRIRTGTIGAMVKALHYKGGSLVIMGQGSKRRPATQSRGIQHLRGGEEGLPLIPETLMLDAFKGLESSPKASEG